MYSSTTQLPSLIRDRRYVPAIDELHSIFFEQFSLSEKQYVALRDVEDAILLGSVSIADIPSRLRDAGISETLITDIARLVVSRYCTLFQDFLGDLTGVMTSLGISKEENVAYIREALSPHNVLPAFMNEYFSEANMASLPKDTMNTCIDTLLDVVSQQAPLAMIRMRMETTLAGHLSEEGRVYIIKTIDDDIQIGGLVPQWAWYYRTLADNVINASVPLYEQPILPILRAINTREDTTTQVKEYFYLWTFSHLDPEVQARITSVEWKQAISDYEEQSGYIVYPLVISHILGEYTLEQIVSLLKEKYSLEVEDASMMRKQIVALIGAAPVLAENTTPPPSSQSLNTPTIPEHADTPLPPVPDVKKQEINYELIIDQILKDSGLDIKDETVLAKVRAILLTRVRGIRDAIDARESLTVLFSKSGSGLDRQSALTLVKEANKYADMLASGTVPELAIPQPPIMEVSQPAMVETTTVMAGQPSKSVVSSPIRARSRVQKHPSFGVSGHTPVAASVPAPETQKPRFAIEEVEGVPMIVEKKDQAVAVPTTSNMPRSSATPVAQSRPIPANLGAVPDNLPLAPTAANQVRPITVRQGGMPSPHKTVLSDVKMAPPRLMDPVEELRAFTIRDFRRLSADPFAAIKHMYQKIKLLEKDSVSRKVAGINAWKANEVSALYTAIGQESFGSGRTIKDSIAARTQQGKPVLSEQEFDALMELNEMLRF